MMMLEKVIFGILVLSLGAVLAAPILSLSKEMGLYATLVLAVVLLLFYFAKKHVYLQGQWFNRWIGFILRSDTRDLISKAFCRNMINIVSQPDLGIGMRMFRGGLAVMICSFIMLFGNRGEILDLVKNIFVNSSETLLLSFGKTFAAIFPFVTLALTLVYLIFPRAAPLYIEGQQWTWSLGSIFQFGLVHMFTHGGYFRLPSLEHLFVDED